MNAEIQQDANALASLYDDKNVIYFDSDDGDEIEQPCIVALTAYEPDEPPITSGGPDNWSPGAAGTLEGVLLDTDGYVRPDWEEAIGPERMGDLLFDAVYAMQKEYESQAADAAIDRHNAD